MLCIIIETNTSYDLENCYDVRLRNIDGLCAVW